MAGDGMPDEELVPGRSMLLEVQEMADWVCKKCGYVRDSRCKPKKCPKCEAQETFEKKEETKKS